MSISDLIRRMKEAGAPMDAILIAVEAVEDEQAKDAARRAKRAEQKRKERSKGRDNDATVARQLCDDGATVAPVSQEPEPRADIYTTRAPALFPVGLSNDNPPIVTPFDCPPNSETAPRKASRAKPRTQISESQLPTEPDVKAAVEAGLSATELTSEWRRFRDFHRAKGSLMADWSAAWRTWLGNRERFGQARAGPSPGERSGVAKQLAEAYGVGQQRNRAEAESYITDFRALPVIDGGERIENNGDDGRLFGRLLVGDG